MNTATAELKTYLDRRRRHNDRWPIDYTRHYAGCVQEHLLDGLGKKPTKRQIRRRLEARRRLERQAAS